MNDAPRILPFPPPTERADKNPRNKIGYVEFAVASNFSFLRDASHPEELMLQANHLELTGLGLCDRNSVAGVVRAHLIKREKELVLRYHPGTRLVFADGTPDILAYPRDRPAWGRLCRLLTVGNLRAEKGDCVLYLDDLLAHIEGLELIVMPNCTRDVAAKLLHKSRTSFAQDDERFGKAQITPLASPLPLAGEVGPRSGPGGGLSEAIALISSPSPTLPRKRGREQAASAAKHTLTLHRLRETAPGRVRLAAMMLYRGNDRARLAARAKLTRDADIPLIAVNDVLYHHHDRRELQDVLTCIREHVTIDTAGRKLAVNAERYLKPAAEMARLFEDHPEAIEETCRLSDALTFSLDELKYEYPDESIAGFASAQEALEHLTWEGARERYPEGITDAVRKSLANEFKLIASRDYAAYFLTVYDIVRFAREQGILCQGRGSAANSTVCYCLGVTSVDPVRGDLLFERFISTERHEPPDIDVDFEHERREEVIQYIYRKYGRDRTGIAATVISYRGRSAIREVGKAFGLSEDMIGALASSIWGMGGANVRTDALRSAGLDPVSPRVAKIIALAKEIQGFPRHLSQHVGGFVITRSRLDEVIPIMNGAMEARTHVEWDKDDLDALGILKVDVLGLGMLTCLRKGFELADKHYPGWTLSEGKEGTPLPTPPPHASRMFPTCATIEWPTSETSDVGGGREQAAASGRDSSEEESSANEPAVLALPPPLRGRDREGGNLQVDIKRKRGRAFELLDVPAEEKEVYDMLCRADSIGVFQVESRAQMSMLPRLKPRKFYDLVIEVAIVRPGPIQGDMVHPYLIRREKLRETGEEPNYPSPSPEHGDPNELRDVLKKTLGVPLFQEQAMKIAIVAGGFTPGEADKLRRAMATFKRTGTIGTFRDKMINGMTAKGYDPEFAERCFSQIEGFGEYGFPESHAASFALLVYASAWLKCRYPDVFAAALLNSQPMGFYAPAQIVRDAREHGVEVRPVDINHSGYDNTLEPGPRAAGRLHALHREMVRDVRSTHAMRLGFREIKGISKKEGELIVEKRFRPTIQAIQDGASQEAASALAFPPPCGSRMFPTSAALEWPTSETSDVGWGRDREGGKRQISSQVITPLPTPPPCASRMFPTCATLEWPNAETPAFGGGREQSEQAAEIVPYTSVRDVWLRTGLKLNVLERLADADAFGSLGLTRRQALWAVKALGRAGDQDDLPLMQHSKIASVVAREQIKASASSVPSPLEGEGQGGGYAASSEFVNTPLPIPPPHASRMFPTCATIEWPTSETSDVGGGREPASASGKLFTPNPQRQGSFPGEPHVTLPPMPLGEEVVNDYRFLKLSLRAHPASFLRADLARRRIIVNEELRTRRNGEYVRVSGLVTIRQRPGSANGVIFMTIEDETAIANLIVWPKTFERFRPIVLGARYICATGKMQQQSGVIHVVADRLEDLTPLLGQLMEDAPPIEAYARADEVKGQQSDPRERTSRAERYASFAENIDVAADLGITAPGSAHAPTRKAAPKMR